MKKILVSLILLLILNSFLAQAQESFEVSDIRVEGLSRISAETIFSYLPVGVGDEIDEEKSLIAKFGEGATKSGATLKGIFEKAIGSKKKKKEDK